MNEEIVLIDILLKNDIIDSFTVQIPCGQIRTNELVPPIFALFDRIVELELVGKQISCHKGCSICCAQLIPLSPVEAFFLTHLMSRWPAAHRNIITSKIHNIRQISKKVGLPQNLLDIYRTPDFERLYFSLGIPCPFLEDGACSIYTHRPLVCRDYNVVSPPSFCVDPYNNEPARVKIGVNMGALMTAFCARLYTIPPLPIPLFHFMEWSQQHRDALSTRVSGQWLWEALLNGLAQITPKASRIQCIRWKYRQPRIQNNSPLKTKAEAKHFNQTRLSPLFILFSQGQTARNRKKIQEMLQKGENIENGAVLPPTQIPKLLTAQANSEVITTIFQTLLRHNPDICRQDVLLEIGAGDGYLRYLLDRTKDPKVQRIAQRMVETEVSTQIVGENKAKGKYMICLGISDLPAHFGQAFAPCIVSLNVLDLFSAQQLNEHLSSIRQVLKDEGMVLHIMSSAIHIRVFEDVALCHPNALLLPYCQEGRVGVRLASTRSAITEEMDGVPNHPEDLANIFAKHPDRYFEWADRIARWFEHSREKSRCLPLDHFSALKICQALQQNGFHLLMNKQVQATAFVERSKFHDAYPGQNGFHNSLGALIASSQILPRPNQVLEKSTFRIILARKAG